MFNAQSLNALTTLLSDSLKTMALPISESDQTKLIAYVELLFQWNAVHNLTAVREPKEMVIRHVLDSLTVLPFLSAGENTGNLGVGKNVCDVGTGAGLPGLILALCKPDINFVLLDSNQKKINFVQQAILKLRLSNAKAVCRRVEQYHPEREVLHTSFDWVVSRAFSSLSDFIQQTAHLGDEKTIWLAMKGKLLQEELAALPTGYTMVETQAVLVPNLEAERHLVMVKRI